MKKIIGFVLVCSTVALVSCLDTEEKITLKDDKSGTYQLTMNLAGMMEQLKAFKPDAAETFSQQKDTVIYFKGFTDTATSLTPEEKTILQNGKLHLAMNDDIKVEFELPFANMDQLLYIKQHMFEMIGKLKPQNLDSAGSAGSLFPGMGDMMGSGNAGGMPMGAMGGAGKLFNPAQDGFDFSISKGMISNKAKDKEGLTATFASDSMQMLKQMIPFVGDFNYTTTFVLPTPVKKYSGGAETKLSDDKKTISFMNSLSALLDKPEALEYSLEY